MKKILLCSILFTSFLGFIFINYNLKGKEQINGYINGKPVYVKKTIYAYDVSTPLKAINTSDYVFVAKTNKIVNTEYRDYVEVEVSKDEKKQVADSYTIYSVNVIKNIKGNLKMDEDIEIEQYGGLSLDKTYYSFFEGVSILEEGNYYLLLGSSPFDGSRVLVNIPEKIIKLENYDNSKLDDSNKMLINKYTIVNSNSKTVSNSIWGNYVSHISKYDINYN